MHIAEPAERQREFGDNYRPFATSTKGTRSRRQRRDKLLDLDPQLCRRDRGGLTRLGASLIVRMPWSVKFSDTMDVGINFP